jgi:hypothetical protein
MMMLFRRQRSAWWTLLPALGLLAAFTGTRPAAAQTSGPPASGEFTGAITLDGGFVANVDQSGVSGSVTVFVEGSGPLEIVLDEGQMSGEWTLEGTQWLTGAFGADSGGAAGVVAMSGEGSFTGHGAVVGPPSDYRMSGSVTTTNSVSVSVAEVISQSATSTDTSAVDSPLTDVIVLCQSIHGRWDHQIKQSIEQVGFQEYVSGYFSASTGIDATEQAEAVEQLVEDVARWASDAQEFEPGPGATGLYIGRALSLLERSQELQAELAADVPCPPDPSFATHITRAAQDVLARLIADFPHITNSRIVALAAGAGAIGSGSPLPDRARALEQQLEADVVSHIQELLDAEEYGPALVEEARTAQMLGVASVEYRGNEVGLSDLLILLAGEAS